MELFGGTVASELLYALALGATCLAYGVDLNLAQLVFINTAASVLSSVIPVPGGIGAAEAALSTGLITMGVDEFDGIRDRYHSAALHLLPTSHLGIFLTSLAQP